MVFSIEVITLTIDNATLEEYEKVYFANHPRAKKKPIPHPYHESINQWMVMKRPMMNALKQRWKDFIIWFIDSAGYTDKHIDECEIVFRTYYATNVRHDVDNGCPKFILDGLCESGFVIDDDSKHITSLTLQCFVDTDNPRTEIEVHVSKVLTNYKRKELKEAKPMAKKKLQRISVNALDEVMKGIQENRKVVEWNGMEVVITPTLSLEEMLSFARGVVQSCFDLKTNAYMPEVKDFVIRVNIMQKYANFTLPAKTERQYDIVMQSGAVEMIMKHINTAQFNELLSAIEDKIANTAEANVQAMYKQFNDVVTAFEGLQEKMGAMFDGVNSADLQKLVSALDNGKIDEGKVAAAYLEHTEKSKEA